MLMDEDLQWLVENTPPNQNSRTKPPETSSPQKPQKNNLQSQKPNVSTFNEINIREDIFLRMSHFSC